jgi:hypothetical protein
MKKAQRARRHERKQIKLAEAKLAYVKACAPSSLTTIISPRRYQSFNPNAKQKPLVRPEKLRNRCDSYKEKGDGFEAIDSGRLDLRQRLGRTQLDSKGNG